MTMESILNTLAAIGWAIALLLGIQNYNLRREIIALKEREDRRERENKIKHQMFETVLIGLSDIIAQTESIANAKAKVDEIWEAAEAQANEELKNEPDLET